MERIFSTIYNSTLGRIRIEGNEDAITLVSFLEEEDNFTGINDELPGIINRCLKEIDDYFNGRRLEFDLPLQLDGTVFQQNIWKLLLDIPFGKTMSYIDLSKKHGDVKAIRAVASANGKNPVGIIVPCHRVIGNKGDLVGYAGKLWRKKWLLDHENVVVSRQQSLFFR